MIFLYNSLQEAKPELGTLMVQGDLTKPSVVIFRSRAPDMTPVVKMKAFALKGIPPTDWNKLRDELERELAILAHAQREANGSGSSIEIHEGTALLIVIGPEAVLEAAESLVTAWEKNHLSAPTPLSGQK